MIQATRVMTLASTLLTISPAVFSQGEGMPPGILSASEEAMILIYEGDALFSSRDEKKGAAEALAAYEKALRKDPGSVAALWKASRAVYWIADHADNKREKIKGFEKGIDYAKEGIRLDSKSAESHFWLGGNYGTYGETKGILKSLALVKPIRQEMEILKTLDESFYGGAAYRVLGIVDYKVPGFAGGSKKRALENLTKAVSIDPENAFNQYYIAEYYDAVGERYKALDHLKKLETLASTNDVDIADLKMMKERGSKLKKKIEKKR